MTPAIVRAVLTAQALAEDELLKLRQSSELSLAEPEVGNPISHGQLIDISKLLKKHADKLKTPDNDTDPIEYHLNSLLKGSRIYIPPPPPRIEPTSAYKALMARLRREEEARAYERMLHPLPASETFTQRFPASPLSRLNPTQVDLAVDEDDVTYEDVHRQIILIINVLVSIIACSVFIWVAARHWSTPKRLGLSMSGSGIVAIAEVVIYSGYVRRVKEAKVKEKAKPEIKEIIESWVIDADSGKKGATVSSVEKEKVDDGIRYRKGKHR
ncbi:uncharacterized protein BDR25DRAFT_206999 [Lindgomyces ingoldianus]|uniref:Uncharacterized protein n=1 Tax=Lindgomyces ingoldianus TaxID=673940 RepID=A0ACB6RHQ0_9PLEO|nr:uncharacterized protein BDR25DRAFT_206999 [Lindgomyces ingoldianus]KAF2477996.1 hypothetical protein BDR25DRAFT_206999 [Lindgomyces ingoldianus]